MSFFALPSLQLCIKWLHCRARACSHHLTRQGVGELMRMRSARWFCSTASVAPAPPSGQHWPRVGQHQWHHQPLLGRHEDSSSGPLLCGGLGSSQRQVAGWNQDNREQVINLRILQKIRVWFKVFQKFEMYWILVQKSTDWKIASVGVWYASPNCHISLIP